MNESAADPPSARVVVDLGALAANYATLVRLAAPAEVSAVVKADAYGLGLGPVVTRLAAAGCRSFFVSTPAEGQRLRAAVPDARIFPLQDAAAALTTCRNAGLVPVLNTPEEVETWRVHGGGAPVALQLDTGMTRSGLSPEDVIALAARPERLAGLRIALVMTHLACADEPDHPLNAEQLARFARLRALLPAAPCSIANSAGIALGADYHGDLVRPGLSLYGGRALAHGGNPMRTVVRVEARVLQIRALAEDARVGYGATWHARAPARIATLGAGYADGYPRSLGNRGYVQVAGRRLPVIGRVSMDLTTIDVTELSADALRVGDYVELLGADVPLEDVAERAGTLSYELLTRLSPRLPRVYV